VKPKNAVVADYTEKQNQMRIYIQHGYRNLKTALVGWRVLAMAAAVLFCALMAYAQTAPACAPLDASVRSRVLQVAARTMGIEPILPVIDREALLPGTCYWQLFVTLPHNHGHATLYLSPDHRFVSTQLWDLTSDFNKEDAQTNDQLHAEAEVDHPPSRGPEGAPVTVVLFSDFQCPYCASFSQMVEQYQKDNPGKIRLIFRNNPLPMHKWAKDAARAGICVARQAPDAFWQFQEFLFLKQKETTADNLQERVKEFLQTVKYLECMSGPYPETRLNRDVDEATTYHIHSTPTLFINGRRHGGFGSIEEFSGLVDASIHATTATPQGGNK
jgi:protein-disulfide isomerase